MTGRVDIVAHENLTRENKGPPKFRNEGEECRGSKAGFDSGIILQKARRDGNGRSAGSALRLDHNPKTLGITWESEIDQMRRVLR
jgi:hypothetical protein